MRRIVEKLEEKGYKADSELALNLYNGLMTSLRHDETVFFALPGVLLALVGLQALRLEAVVVLVLLIFSLAWIVTIRRYVASLRLLSRLANVIAEDPLDEIEKEGWITIIAYGLLWIAPIVLLLRNSGIL